MLKKYSVPHSSDVVLAVGIALEKGAVTCTQCGNQTPTSWPKCWVCGKKHDEN